MLIQLFVIINLFHYLQHTFLMKTSSAENQGRQYISAGFVFICALISSISLIFYSFIFILTITPLPCALLWFVLWITLFLRLLSLTPCHIFIIWFTSYNFIFLCISVSCKCNNGNPLWKINTPQVGSIPLDYACKRAVSLAPDLFFLYSYHL